MPGINGAVLAHPGPVTDAEVNPYICTRPARAPNFRPRFISEVCQYTVFDDFSFVNRQFKALCSLVCDTNWFG